MGDATDPFDGVRFRRLSLATNPSSDRYSRFATASTGLDVEMTRSGDAMRLDVSWPRWSGAIADTVQWVGSVVVDGDLTVEPEGVLMIHPGTTVRVTGTDRIHAGTDPAQVEFRIRGGLEIGRYILWEAIGSGSSVRRVQILPEQTVFQGLNAGERWYGIILEPEPGKEVWITENTYRILDADNGFVVSRAPPGGASIAWVHQVIDESGLETTGNGDGRLNPGEAFQLEVAITNGTLITHTKAKVALSWETDLIHPTWAVDVLSQDRRVRSDPFAVFPGGVHHLRLPSLKLSSKAKEGESVELALEIDDGTRLWNENLTLAITGSPPFPEIEWEVPGRGVFGQTLVIPGEEATPIRVRLDGSVDAVELVTVRGSRPVAEVPMVARAGGDGTSYFEATVHMRQPGMHRFFLRLKKQNGAVVLSPSSLHVWSAREKEADAALVFVGSIYQGRYREKLADFIAERVEGVGLRAQLVDEAPAGPEFYQALLPHYRGDDNLVIWLGDTLDRKAQQAMSDFLDDEGRLLLVSSRLHESDGIEAFIGQVLHAQVRQGRASTRKVRSLYLDG